MSGWLADWLIDTNRSTFSSHIFELIEVLITGKKGAGINWAVVNVSIGDQREPSRLVLCGNFTFSF